jgi:hypothetical protein
VIEPGALVLLLLGCNGHDVHSEPPSSGPQASADADLGSQADASDDAASGQGDVGTAMQDSPDATDERSASDPLDSGSESDPTPGSLTCVRSTRYAGVEPCPADGGPFVSFECGGLCLEFVTLLGPGMNMLCQLGGSTADGAIPITDAGTIVACCPPASSQLSTPVRCEGPFM